MWSVPDNYFDDLPERISEKISDMESLKANAPQLFEMEKKTPFLMPENYFENLPDRISEKISDVMALKAIAPELSAIEKKNSFLIPGNYFKNLPDRISEKISDVAALKAIAPELSEMEKKNSFLIPENYFEQLPQRINEKTTGKLVLSAAEVKEAVIRPIYSPYKNFYRRFYYAAAAAAVIILFFYFWNSLETNINKKELYVSAEEITNSMFFLEIDESTLIEEVCAQIPDSSANHDIEEYLINNYVDEQTVINEL